MENDFSKTEDLFKRIFPEIFGKITHGEREEAIMFFDHGEYGIAFECICAALKNSSVSISRENYSLIQELGKEMCLHNSNWEDILREG